MMANLTIDTTGPVEDQSIPQGWPGDGRRGGRSVEPGLRAPVWLGDCGRRPSTWIVVEEVTYRLTATFPRGVVASARRSGGRVRRRSGLGFFGLLRNTRLPGACGSGMMMAGCP